VSGIHPGLIGEKARVVMAAEDDCKSLAELEVSAQRVTLEQTEGKGLGQIQMAGLG